MEDKNDILHDIFAASLNIRVTQNVYDWILATLSEESGMAQDGSDST